MKKIVLILDGVIAKNFLDVLTHEYFNYNTYVVVSADASFIPQTILSNFSYHHFDPTSEYKLNHVLSSEVMDAFVLLEDLGEKRVVYEILRKYSSEMRIVIDVKDEKEAQLFHGEKTLVINETELISGAICSRIPNVPAIPQHFGLGKGEIMEISIPVGSVFAYRHIGSIQQKNYKIVGIYRQNEFLLSKYSMVIRPADTLLVAGEPQVLQNVYRQIKNDFGQFPAPFGRDIYLYVDMFKQSKNAVMRDINQALFLHRHLKNAKLFIVVLHPRNLEMMQELKKMDSPDVQVIFDYGLLEFDARFLQDQKKRIGMVAMGREIFSSGKVRKLLFKSQIPVFKTSSKEIQDLQKSIVVLNERMNETENISSVIFDVSIQMGLEMHIYDFDPDGHYQSEVLQNYQNLSRLLNKKIIAKQTQSKNPILFLQEQKEVWLHFLPFERCITGRKILNSFSTQVERISFMLDHHPQIFVPISEKVK